MKNLFIPLLAILFFFSCDDIIQSEDPQEPPKDEVPILNITTQSPVVSREDYVKGTFQIEGDTAVYSLQIRGRGNSTWYQPKKPFKIKFDSKQSIFGFPADKEWALLANYLDKSLLRNDVAFEISNRLEMAWTPRRQFVNLYLNNTYLGNYLLCETEKISKDRVDIKLIDPKKSKDTANDFLVEADQHQDGLQIFKTPQQLPFVIKEPDSVSQFQYDYIKDKISLTEHHIANYDYKEIKEEVDLDSWIKWMIVNELMRNSDAPLVSSVFFYKKSTKLFMGPVWDFDASSGNYNGNFSTGWYVNEGSWFGGLFLYHPYYKQRFKEVWNQYKDTLSSIPVYVETKATYIDSSANKNYKTWPNLLTQDRGDQMVTGSYKGEVKLLRDFLSARFDWMDSQIQKF